MDENFENKKMYKVDCSQCGQETEVPFKPDGERPVYCKKCFRPNNNKKQFGGRSKMRYDDEDDDY